MISQGQWIGKEGRLLIGQVSAKRNNCRYIFKDSRPEIGSGVHRTMELMTDADLAKPSIENSALPKVKVGKLVRKKVRY